MLLIFFKDREIKGPYAKMECRDEFTEATHKEQLSGVEV